MEAALTLLMSHAAKLLYLLPVGLAGLLTAKLINTGLSASLSPGPRLAITGASDDTKETMFQAPLSAFLERNLFGAKREQAQPPSPKPNPDLDPNDCQPGDGATLLATVVSPDDGLAFISAKESYERYSVGDRLSDGRRIAAIERQRIVLDREGRCETLALGARRERVAATRTRPPPPSSPFEIKSKGANTYEISRATVEKIRSDPGAVMQHARVVPLARGAQRGLKFLSVRRGGLYDQLGLKRGDLITRINGHELDQLGRFVDIYTKLQDADSLSVDLIRGGVKRTVRYDIQ